MLLILSSHCESAKGETKQSVFFNTNPFFILFLFFLLSFTPLTNLYSQTFQPNPDSIPFAPAVSYPTGDGPQSVFCADLDGDENLDLAVTNPWNDIVSILKNNGDGTFQAKVDYGAGYAPFSVFCADLDGDTDLDLAVGNWISSNVSILKNNGDGTFQTKVDYGAGWGPISIFCADLDGDIDLDLAVANTGSNNVSILKNNGDGTFQTKMDYGAGDYPYSVFCADLDGDTDLDLAVANYYSNNVSVLKNNGDGTFQAKVDYGAGNYPYSVFCADLDGDTDLDLAVANEGSVTVSILKNNGNGTFNSLVNYEAGDGSQSVFCADLDKDGDLDLAVANRYSDSVSILLNLSNFARPNSYSLISPVNTDSVKTPVIFHWQPSIDPDPNDTVRYDLYLSRSIVFNPDSTIVLDSLLDTTFTDSLDIKLWYWKVKAYDRWGATRWSAQTWSFYVDSPPNSYSLISPGNADSVKTPVTLTWQKSIDPDSNDTVRYDLYLSRSIVFAPESTIVYDSLLDTTFTDSLDIKTWYWKVKAYDKWGALRWSDQIWSFYVYLCGDCNGDGKISVSDVICEINYLFKGGSAPVPLIAGDVNCNGKETVSDVVYKINYLFKGGPPPCQDCP